MKKFIIDSVAIGAVGILAHASFHNWPLTVASQVLTGVYACWSFYCGAKAR